MENNFAEQLLDMGFAETYQEKFRPKDNWLGCSRYYPDAIFEKEDTRVDISMCGTLVRATPEELDAHKELFDTMSVKYIRVVRSGKEIYKTFSGIVPDTSIL